MVGVTPSSSTAVPPALSTPPCAASHAAFRLVRPSGDSLRSVDRITDGRPERRHQAAVARRAASSLSSVDRNGSRHDSPRMTLSGFHRRNGTTSAAGARRIPVEAMPRVNTYHSSPAWSRSMAVRVGCIGSSPRTMPLRSRTFSR